MVFGRENKKGVSELGYPGKNKQSRAGFTGRGDFGTGPEEKKRGGAVRVDFEDALRTGGFKDLSRDSRPGEAKERGH